MEEGKQNITAKRVVIIRHSKAKLFTTGSTDFARDLKEQGKNDADFVSKELLKLNIIPQLIISSPAKRALKTARIFGRNLNTNSIILNEALYDESYDRDWMVLDIEQNCPQGDTVYIIGHNPLLKDLIEDLTGQTIEQLKTSTAVIIRFEIEHWNKIISGIKGEIERVILKS